MPTAHFAGALSLAFLLASLALAADADEFRHSAEDEALQMLMMPRITMQQAIDNPEDIPDIEIPRYGPDGKKERDQGPAGREFRMYREVYDDQGESDFAEIIRE